MYRPLIFVLQREDLYNIIMQYFFTRKAHLAKSVETAISTNFSLLNRQKLILLPFCSWFIVKVLKNKPALPDKPALMVFNMQFGITYIWYLRINFLVAAMKCSTNSWKSYWNSFPNSLLCHWLLLLVSISEIRGEGKYAKDNSQNTVASYMSLVLLGRSAGSAEGAP